MSQEWAEREFKYDNTMTIILIKLLWNGKRPEFQYQNGPQLRKKKRVNKWD